MLLILFVNIVVGLAYTLVFLKGNSLEDKIFKAVVALFIPVAGLVFIFISDRFEKSENSDLALESENEYMIEKTKVNIDGIVRIDIEKEINIVPIEETLILNKSDVKRKLLIEILKDDPSKYISVIRKALKDEDTEVSHYAATAIMELKRTLTKKIQEIEERMEVDDDLVLMIEYTEVVKKFITSNLLDYRTQERYLQIYSEVLDKILNKVEPSEKYFCEKIELELAERNFDAALKLCKNLQKLFPESEESIIMSLKINYEMKNYNEFQKIIDSIGKLPIRFSNRGLKIIRFWLVRA